MESAFTYLANLADAFEDVGKGTNTTGTKNNNPTTPVCQETGFPNCSLDITNSTEDYTYGNNDFELEGQLHNRLTCFEDECYDGGDDQIQHSASNASGRGTYSAPLQSDKKSFSSIFKSKSQEIASRMSILQSLSVLSGNDAADNKRDPHDVSKSESSLSNTTNETDDDDDIENDDSGFDWADSLSSNGSDDIDFYQHQHQHQQPKRYTKRHRRYLAPPPKHPHLEWFAHGLVWTLMAITFGWVGTGLSYMGRQSPAFVQLEVPMYLDPRYEEIQAVGMLQLELCFNETHLDILEELNDSVDEHEPGQEPQRMQKEPETRSYDPAGAADQDYDYHDFEDFAPSVVDLATTPCIHHKLNSDDVHDDHMYEIARSVAFLSMVFGAFVTIFLTCSVFWKTINLRPIGAGYLIAYFLQSFTFLIFDSNLCKDHAGCRMSGGGNYSAIASFCWILACAACARMDKRKHKNLQREQDANEQKDREYQLQRVETKDSRRRSRPEQITIQKQTPTHSNTRDAQESREGRKSRSQPRSIPASLVNNNEKILRDLEKMNTNPIYIPTLPETNENPVYIPVLPETPPSSTESIRLESSMSTEESIRDLDVEEPKKPRSKKSKSKQKKNTVEAGSEEPKKPRSKKSKSKGESKKRLEIEDRELIQSQSSLMTTSSKEERVKKPKSSKKKKSGSKKQLHAELDQDPLQERPRSSRKSKKDVNDKDEKKKSGNTTIVGEAQQNPTITKKRSSSRRRKSKIDAKPEHAILRESVRKSIEEGKHYEL